MISKSIDDFLTFLRETRTLNRIAVANEEEANNQTQDILHSLELGKHDAVEYTKLAIQLRNVRQARRAAKDLIATTAPVVAWIAENGQTIHQLERLLGDVRKAEKSLENRIYIPKAKNTEGVGK